MGATCNLKSVMNELKKAPLQKKLLFKACYGRKILIINLIRYKLNHKAIKAQVTKRVREDDYMYI